MANTFTVIDVFALDGLYDVIVALKPRKGRKRFGVICCQVERRWQNILRRTDRFDRSPPYLAKRISKQ
jgi:hypothetical protein